MIQQECIKEHGNGSPHQEEHIEQHSPQDGVFTDAPSTMASRKGQFFTHKRHTFPSRDYRFIDQNTVDSMYGCRDNAMYMILESSTRQDSSTGEIR